MADVLLGMFDLNEKIEQYRPDEHNAAGRRAETLIKNDYLRVVLVTMRTGITLREHTAPGPITVQVLRGRFRFSYEGHSEELVAGSLIALEKQTPHEVETLEEGAFLITIGWGARVAD